MNIKTYHASTMKEALDMVKGDLGSEAVILHTRCVKQGGFFGFGGREVVELTASNEVHVLPRESKYANQSTESAAPQHAVAEAQTMVRRTYASPVATAEPGESVEDIREEINSIKALITDHFAQENCRKLGKVSEELGALYRTLLRRKIHPDVARGIIKRLRRIPSTEETEPAERLAQLRNTIADLVKTAPPIEPTGDGPVVVALIGPTGVGKTTTIAKLAASFKFVKGYDVGLVTLDTYRIAAVQQLKTYADIIGIPVNVILTPEELREARETFADKDIVLVDTAGRSQRNAEKMEELKLFLDAGDFDQIHLVISSTIGESNLEEIMERFAPLASDHMILSKLDEGTCPGHVLRVVLKSGKRLSYITTGQEVPDDIESADAMRFASIMLGEGV